MSTKTLGFKIIKDHLPLDDNTGKEGKTYNDFKETENDYLCRSYDDDGVLYFTARCNSEEAAEIFTSWSERDSGSVYTEIKKLNETEWQSFIG